MARPAVLGRIEKGDVALENQFRFVGFGVGGPFVQRARGDGQNAETVGAQIIVFLDEIADENGFHGQDFALAFKAGATGKNGLRRALGQDEVFVVRGFDNDGHHLAGKVEGDFVHLFVIVNTKFLPGLGMAQDGAIQHVFQAGLEMADEVGIEQDGVAFLFEDVAMNFQDDVIAGEGAGLVGAKHVHGAEVLDGIEAFDDDFFVGHGQRALGEADGDNHRQHFRGQTDGHRQGEEKGPGPVMPAAFFQGRRVSVLQQQAVEPEIVAARVFQARQRFRPQADAGETFFVVDGRPGNNRVQVGNEQPGQFIAVGG